MTTFVFSTIIEDNVTNLGTVTKELGENGTQNVTALFQSPRTFFRENPHLLRLVCYSVCSATFSLTWTRVQQTKDKRFFEGKEVESESISMFHMCAEQDC